MQELIQDARYAARTMRRSPGFAAVVVLTLALGIGANTAMFSVLYGVWLAPAPYANAGRLVDFSMQQLSGNRLMGGTSMPNLADWKAQTSLVEAIGVHRFAHYVNVSGAGEVQEAIGHRVSANLFDVLGARPLLGTAIDPAADRSGGPRQALIHYDWWKQHFGGDRGVVGRQISVDGEAFIIAGVMPRGFDFPAMVSAAWLPVLWMSLNLPPEQERARESHSLDVVARLNPGVSIGRAQAEMNTVSARLAAAYPAEDGGWGVKVAALTDVRQLSDVRPALVLLMSAASLVLLIACANTANLLLARAAGREREIAVRRALGITRSRLVRQLLTESALLALAGGAAGVLLAYASLPLLRAGLPAAMPRTGAIHLNGLVLIFAAAVSLLTGLVFGLAPVMRPGSGRTARSKAAKVLVVAEVALAMLLLVGAGLLLESLRRALNVDLGFRKEQVLTARFDLTKRSYPDGRRVRAFREELLRKVTALPGVQYAATVSSLPMGVIAQGTEFEVEGRPETAVHKPFASFANTSTDYLRAMEIPLLAGRYFSNDDTSAAPPVAVVSESVARAWWPGGAALGKRIRFDEAWFTIIGIVKDVRQSSPERAAVGAIYALNEQLPLTAQGAAMGRFNVLVVRTAAGAGGISAAIRRAVAEIDKDQPLANVATMERIVETNLAPRRLNTLLLGLFAALAVTLAGVGVFGVGSYAVARRTKEIGIRMALGATPAGVLNMIAREAMLVAAIGTAIGFGASIATSRLLARFLFGVKPLEPAIVAAVAVTLVAIVVGSGLLPARRAMRVDPTVALRQD